MRSSFPQGSRQVAKKRRRGEEEEKKFRNEIGLLAIWAM
jgi:hypothetical protein